MPRLHAFFLLLPLALWAAGCDCAGTISGSNLCTVPNGPSSCGDPCDTDGDCGSGTACADGQCQAECTPADLSQCEPGADSCTDRGQCSRGSGSDGGLTDAGDGGEGGEVDAGACASVELMANRATPNVLLIVDRSSSMNTTFGGGDSRWLTIKDEVLRQPDGLVAPLAASVRFGLVLYTSGDRATPEVCPELETVSAALDNRGPIQSEWDMHSPRNGTPTGATLSTVLADIETLAPERDEPTIFVLATDGEPDTCTDGDDVTGGRAATVSAASDAFDAGIRTFVISLGTEIEEGHLQEVANAGQGVAMGEPDATFFVATDSSALSEALRSIIGAEVDCELALEGRIDPSLACNGTVEIDGEELPCEDPNGWRAVDETTIELTGSACESLQRDGGTVRAVFPCEVILI